MSKADLFMCAGSLFIHGLLLKLLGFSFSLSLYIRVIVVAVNGSHDTKFISNLPRTTMDDGRTNVVPC